MKSSNKLSKTKSNISGFIEYLPEQQMLFEHYKTIISNTFALYGFCPISTPAVEKLDTLLSKGDNHEIYSISRFLNNGPKEDKLGLRFDLTVPLFRYINSHHNELVFPFKRYQIDPVWRGERAQSGRYRQFYQCDIDIVDNIIPDIENDALIIYILIKSLHNICIKDITLYINNRKILIEFLKYHNVDDISSALRMIDKKNKVDDTKIIDYLLSISNLNKAIITDFIFTNRNNAEWISFLYQHSNTYGTEFLSGITELETTICVTEKFGITPNIIKINPSLARGLEYYTGNIFEIVMNNYDIGSIAGGGRYKNSDNGRTLYGTGGSIGLSRIMNDLFEDDNNDIITNTIMIISQDKRYLDDCIVIAKHLWQSNIKAEILFHNTDFKKKIKYADKKNARFIIIVGENEHLLQKATIKDMISGIQTSIDYNSVIDYIKIY